MFELTGVASDYLNMTVRIGVMHDVLGGEVGNHEFSGLRIVQTVGGSGDSGTISLPNDAGSGGDLVADMYFFDITDVNPEKNEGYIQGDELLCYAELSESNLTKAGKRLYFALDKDVSSR